MVAAVRLLLLLFLLQLTCSAVDATSEFLVVQKKIVNHPSDHHFSVEEDAADHFYEALKKIHAAFRTGPNPRAAKFVDSGRDTTSHGPNKGGNHKGGKNRRLLREEEQGAVIMSPQRLIPETRAGSVAYHAAKAVRASSPFFTRRGPVYNPEAARA